MKADNTELRDALRKLWWEKGKPVSLDEHLAIVVPIIREAEQSAREEEREGAAKIADSHKGSAARRRQEKGYKPSVLDPEGAHQSIMDEERGEDIAAEMIAAAIRARNET